VYVDLEKAKQLKENDIILFTNEEWVVVDILVDEDDEESDVTISACRDDAYEVFNHREVSSKVDSGT
jgi:urease accessory protein UreE